VLHLFCISGDVTYDIILYMKIKQQMLTFNRNNDQP